MDQHADKAEKLALNRQRLPYRTPKINEFGPIAATTLAGNGSIADGGNASEGAHAGETASVSGFDSTFP
ncbi:hypothetical protein EY643_02435 [Halioglobus maricola]|uniref:Lasso RiPP family leader peptide-containing protein n=1 Tax=Halioglobus maricola TaxID=2601894 RepID=A0A5P9NFQ0_9GAMM|nr:hypothetical protein [Halioglobus maricola]QFU74601.1 hypothetical protein EY643_02435 [Halioglobus maricola]